MCEAQVSDRKCQVAKTVGLLLFLTSIPDMQRIRSIFPIRNLDITHPSVADLGFSKGGFWFYKKFCSELVEDQKNVAASFFRHIKHTAR